MQSFFKTNIIKIRTWVSVHKKTSGGLGIILLISIWYTYSAITNTSNQIQYVLNSVTRGTIVSSIQATGQVSTNHQLDIKPQVSANIVYIARKQGDFVKRGTLIAQLDTTDPEKSVRDAQANLESAKISLAKIKQPADEVTMLQTENEFIQASSSLSNDYTNGLTDVSNTFIDLPADLNGLYNVIYGTDGNPATGQQRNLDFYAGNASSFETTQDGNLGKSKNLSQLVDDSYVSAKKAYDQNFTAYKNINSLSNKEDINNLINQTADTTNLTASAIRNMSNLIHYYQDLITNQGLTVTTKSNSHLSLLNTYLTAVNGHVNTLAGVKSSIANDTLAVPTKNAALQKLKNGADTLDIQASELSVKKAENALQDAKDNLSKYYIVAPFEGLIGQMNIKNGDPVSSSSVIATMVADIDIANITLNEVDAAKVKIGEKVTLTFDAIDSLALTGKVTKIDTVGTVSQGVVNYNVEITFDATDLRVKPGMSVSASIITDVHSDVLTIPNSAVKTSNGQSYVEIFENNPSIDTANTESQTVISEIAPIKKFITTGLTSDTDTEVVSGLTENEPIVSKTITAKTATASTTPSILNSVGGNNRNALRSTGR